MLVFDCSEYRAYLRWYLGAKGARTGFKQSFAYAIGCQSAFISHVLNSKADLSLEQALRATQFFTFDENETEYFLLLVQKDRAGSQELQKYFQRKIDLILERERRVSVQLNSKTELMLAQQAIYYSHWIYSVVHVLLTIGKLNILDLSKYLGVSPQKINQVIQFLLENQLIRRNGNEFESDPTTHLHLKDDSPLLALHHANYRTLAIESLKQDLNKQIFYSGIVTLSEIDAEKIKAQIVRNLKGYMATIRSSPAKKLYCLNIDFFTPFTSG